MLELTAVQLVLRYKLKKGVFPSDVASLLADFIVDDMPLSRACELTNIVGSFDLVKFIWKRGLQNLGSCDWTVGELVHSEPHYYRWEYSQALIQAVKRGDLSMTSWLCDHFKGCRVTKEVVNEAARGGYLGALQMLAEDAGNAGVVWTSESVQKAAEAGRWDVARWLDCRANTANTRQEDTGTLYYAVQQNNLEQVKWALAMGFSCDEVSLPEVSTIAEWQKTAEIVRYFFSQGHEECVWGAMRAAAQIGDLAFVKWIAPYNLNGDDVFGGTRRSFIVTLENASEHSRLAVVQWLLTSMNDLLLPDGPAVAILAAAKGGALEVVQWLYNRYSGDPIYHLFRDEYTGMSWYSSKENLQPVSAMDLAASNGHLNVLQFLHRVERNKNKKNPMEKLRGLLPTTAAMDGAAAAGHYDVAKWLHTNRLEGCTTNAMDKVVEGNLFIQPGKYRRDVFSEDRLEFLQWLLTHRSEGYSSAAFDNAAANGDLKMLQWLQANTTVQPTTKAMDEAARLNRLDILQWLHENYSVGCSYTAMNVAASFGHLEALQWLHANYPKMGWPGLITAASGSPSNLMNVISLTSSGSQGSNNHHRHLRVIEWLIANRPERNLMPAIRRAVSARQFEVALFLYSNLPVDGEFDAVGIINQLDYESDDAPDSKDIRAWAKDTFEE